MPDGRSVLAGCPFAADRPAEAGRLQEDERQQDDERGPLAEVAGHVDAAAVHPDGFDAHFASDTLALTNRRPQREPEDRR